MKLRYFCILIILFICSGHVYAEEQQSSVRMPWSLALYWGKSVDAHFMEIITFRPGNFEKYYIVALTASKVIARADNLMDLEGEFQIVKYLEKFSLYNYESLFHLHLQKHFH